MKFLKESGVSSTGMLNIVSGTTKKPSSDDKTWRKKDEKVLARIIVNGKANQKAETWKIYTRLRQQLGTLFEMHTDSKAQRGTLIKKLWAMRVCKDGTIQNNFFRVCVVSRQVSLNGSSNIAEDSIYLKYRDSKEPQFKYSKKKKMEEGKNMLCSRTCKNLLVLYFFDFMKQKSVIV